MHLGTWGPQSPAHGMRTLAPSTGVELRLRPWEERTPFRRRSPPPHPAEHWIRAWDGEGGREGGRAGGDGTGGLGAPTVRLRSSHPAAQTGRFLPLFPQPYII